MPGTLFVEPFGGLGNRMRVIVSSINLAMRLNKDLQVIWTIGPDLQCDFNKLFETTSDFTVRSKSNYHVFSSFNQSPLKRAFINLYNRLVGMDLVIMDHDHATFFATKDPDIEFFRRHHNIYIKSCEQYVMGGDWSVFRPISSLQNAIDRLVGNFTRNTIGVHIRRGDNTQAIENSPLNAFLSRMQMEATNDAETNFFIATDDTQVISQIKSTIANDKLIIYEKDFGRSSEKGIQDALIEMYCLSKCNFIIGSYWSSFSEAASKLGKSELIIAGR